MPITEERRDYYKKYHAERREERNAKNRARYRDKPKIITEKQLKAKNAARRRWYEKHKEEHNKKRREQYKQLGMATYYRSFRRFQREKIAQRPRPEFCEVCGDNQTRISFDHCHNTGDFRGWICFHCNAALGHVRDNPDTLRKLASYIETHYAL